MTKQRELATTLLDLVAGELETTFRQNRSCNTLLARYASDVSQALDLPDLTSRFAKLLRKSKWEGFFGGMITNARLPWFVPKRMRQLTSIEKINEDYPLFCDDFASETFTKYYPEMLPCIVNGFDSLLGDASTEVAIEEIALSQVLLRQYDDGLATARRLTESHRRNNVRFVTAIEQYRFDRIDDAEAMKESLDDGTLSGWGAAQFAMGVCNRVPWCPYPYPDY
jgi:hypothetical protein